LHFYACRLAMIDNPETRLRYVERVRRLSGC
jgi:hypothetical protein